ncbi:MFS transporter small subunit [Streptomyces cellostaticus]|uniref:MFS transporter small subunit n=1 Tax=Streptomyces cellostaticus TaxID=67285 RepID=UPI00131E0D87|nr:hypothetical protein [Streptomyces cellostaticus]GHI03029.1 hypothetical protein Scel_13500 [Streptomyces cellostaticus]
MPSDSSPPSLPRSRPRPTGGTPAGLIVLAWLWVAAPLAYGVYELVQKARQLFTG